MNKLELSLPQLGFITATRGLLGTGIGLLAADALRRKNRRSLGFALMIAGAITTIPAALAVYRSIARAKRSAQMPAAMH